MIHIFLCLSFSTRCHSVSRSPHWRKFGFYLLSLLKSYLSAEWAFLLAEVAFFILLASSVSLFHSHSMQFLIHSLVFAAFRCFLCLIKSRIGKMDINIIDVTLNENQLISIWTNSSCQFIFRLSFSWSQTGFSFSLRHLCSLLIVAVLFVFRSNNYQSFAFSVIFFLFFVFSLSLFASVEISSKQK